MATVAAACSRSFLAYVERRGVSRARLLAEAGLSDGELEDPNARVAIERDEMLWSCAARILDDESLGLDYAAHRATDALKSIAGIVARSSRTVEDALVAVATYHRLLRDDGVASFTLSDEGGVLRWAPAPKGACVAEAEDAFLASCLLFARAWTGRAFTPVRVRCQRPKPRRTETYDALFGCPIAFGAPVTELVVPEDVLTLPLHSPHGEVARYLALAADAFVSDLGRTRTYRDDVVAAFDMVGFAQEEVAQHLGWSVRTLQRRLLEGGTGYQALVDEHRQRTALTLMNDRSLTLVQIAHKTGYSDVRSLRRAIRRWRASA